MTDVDVSREAELSKKEICRFCLVQHSNLDSIFVKNTRIKSSASLTLQIMAITSIEVNNEDGMPGFICFDCRLLFEHCYRFKQMCKKAETLLRQYPLTGNWPDPLDKPRAPLISSQLKKEPEPQPKKLLNSMAKPKVKIESVQVLETSAVTKKLLNAAPVSAPEPAFPQRNSPAKRSQNQSKSYEVKVENNQELSMDDVHNLIADIADELDVIKEPQLKSKSDSASKPKVLNKSNIRLLNKGSNTTLEPRIAVPQLKHYDDGNVALVTEILDPDDIDMNTDPVKNAAPVATNVFPCPQCERSFPLMQLLDIHLVNHTRERSFQCTECDKSFFSKYDLQKHTFIHTNERPYKCSICASAFTRRALLHRHERIHTDVPKYICVYCEKQFISREEMDKHSERHTKKRPFQCSICQKSFAFKQGLERHEVIHSKDLPFPCQYCERSFVTAGKLARHLQAHAGKRAYPCKYCPKSYLLSHHLSRHLRMHKQAPAAVFTCVVCKDSHESFDSLVDHSVIHASVSQTCPLCRERISDFDGIEAHMQAHKDGERHACDFCDYIFTTSSQLQKHVENDHVVDMVPYQNDTEETETANDTKDESEILEALLGDENDPIPERKLKQPKIDGFIKNEPMSPGNQKKSSNPKTTSGSPEGKRPYRVREIKTESEPVPPKRSSLKRMSDTKLETRPKNGKLIKTRSSK